MRNHLPLALIAAVSIAAACSGSDDTSPDRTSGGSVVEEPADAPAFDEQPIAATQPTGSGDAAVSGPAPSGDDASVSAPAPGEEPSADDASEDPISEDDMFPDVIDATARESDGAWTISATLSSPYDTPERYADAWRVVGPDGAVYGERILTHDHANEQPFTRSQSGIAIPADVSAVMIEGRDLEFGWGGDTFELVLPR
ncbi:MAG: hypothetical protein AB8G26_08725 [Ilumatobacter sp.]